MWNITNNDLQQLAGSGGGRFVEFVDRLIRAEAAVGGLPQSEILTQLRVNIRDGGVDTEVRGPIPSDRTGWFNVPTCWQYKALAAVSITGRDGLLTNDVISELDKPYAQELIRRGYGYRLCLLGDVAPEKVSDWEAQLIEKVRTINPNAPGPRIVHGGHLAGWCERFPAIAIWLRDTNGELLHFETWQSNCCSVTRQYVPYSMWDRIRKQILAHVDFSQEIVGAQACLCVHGASGVGKTRLVYETLSELEHAKSLVVYTDDISVTKRAIRYAVNNGLSAIIVADECAPTDRIELNELVCGCKDRVRVICLDNTVGQLPAQSGVHMLNDRDLRNTEEILNANFDSVPSDRRRQYVELSGGFIRIAADMCQHDVELSAGIDANYIANLSAYIERRLEPEQLHYLSLVALFDKIGIRDNFRNEAQQLCNQVGLQLGTLDQIVDQTRDVPGFVVRAGRYIYITPDVVCRVLFNQGWRSFVMNDVERFITSLSEGQKHQLLNRAAKYGDEEVRESLSAFFRWWFHNLQGSSLADPASVELTAALVEIRPTQGLSQLQRVVVNASKDEIQRNSDQSNNRKASCRRRLVWLMEDLAAFTEYFAECESVLFRLAENETEQGIVNNATGVWCDLFSVYLSGTSTPFQDRVKVLEQRSKSIDVTELQLVFRAIRSSLDGYHSKTIGRPIVAGRLRPKDWRPKSFEEQAMCYSSLIDICIASMGSKHPHARKLAFDVIVDSLPHIVKLLGASVLRERLNKLVLSDEENRALLNRFDEMLERDAVVSAQPEENDEAALDSEVEEWANSLRPADPDGRLRSICSRSPWDARFSRESTGRDELDDIAEWIQSDPVKHLGQHIKWLNSNEATAAERLGIAIAKHESAFDCGEIIFRHAISRGGAGLLRGYVRGFTFLNRTPSSLALQLLDELQSAQPELAFDILVYAGDKFGSFQRIQQLVENGCVPRKFLANLSMGIGRRSLSTKELGQVLSLLLSADETQQQDAVNAAIRLLRTLSSASPPAGSRLFDEPEISSKSFGLLELSVQVNERRMSHEWGHLIVMLCEYDAARSIQLLVRALKSDSPQFANQAKTLLIKLAAQYPNEVMSTLGDLFLDKNNKWRLAAHDMRKVISAIPDDVVNDWVQVHGLMGARAIAQHLPAPYADEKGEPVLPQVLDSVLRKFDDDQVIQSFISGCHVVEFWSGNGEEKFRSEAELAQRFLNHPIRGIRAWAAAEYQNRSSMAEYERQHDEERFL
ncbi:MAG: hypothetical protein AB7G28_12710 [Pirellulales bacterium]